MENLLQATLELRGKGDVNLLIQTNRKPMDKVMKRNGLLRSALANIRKA